MDTRARLACMAGDAARWGITHVLRRNGGNMPGAIASRICPDIVARLGEGLDGSVVVTGTNGKTTTTGLLADALGATGAGVVCNRAGNNMEAGIAAAMVQGRKDPHRPLLGCFECDELYTVRVLPQLRPGHLVLLNLFRDQLDRYGEIDHTQAVIAEALRTSPTTALVVNADDPLCAAVDTRVENPVVAFGIDEPTGDGDASGRVSDSRFCPRCNAPMEYEYVQYGQLGKYHCPSCGWGRPELSFAIVNVRRAAADGAGQGGYRFDVEDRRGEQVVTYPLSCHYTGLYMVYNITAAFVARLCAGLPAVGFQDVLDAYRPIAGRMQSFSLPGGLDATCNLAKNPAGFNQMLEQVKADSCRLVALFLNDTEADGRDVSWIWDVDFECLAQLDPVLVCVGGSRAAELAMRIKYAGVRGPVQVVDGAGQAAAALARAACELCADEDGQAADAGTGVPVGGVSDRTGTEVVPRVRAHFIANYTACPTVVAQLEEVERTGSLPDEGHGLRACAPQPAAACPVEGMDRPLHVVHLYPDALNLYGDGGNIASLVMRCRWRGIPVTVERVLMGQELDLDEADIVLLGGGSDRDQLAVANELSSRREALERYVHDGGVLLAICGGYQLLGDHYAMAGNRVDGLRLVDAWTESGDGRLIRNTAIESPVSGVPVVGFENHAGRTSLGGGERPLGTCLLPGGGNNGTDGTEGILHGNVLGTYLHGPVLPKNPEVSDWLVSRALERRGLSCELAPLPDEFERMAHDRALELARQER